MHDYDDIRTHDYSICSNCYRRMVLYWVIAFGVFPLSFFFAALGRKSVVGSVVVLLAWLAVAFSLAWRIPSNQLRKRTLEERRAESAGGHLGGEPVYAVMDSVVMRMWMQKQTEAMLVIFSRGLPEMEDAGRRLLKSVSLRGHKAEDWFGDHTAFGALVDMRAADPGAFADLAAHHLLAQLGQAYSPDRAEVIPRMAPGNIPAAIVVQWRTSFTYVEPAQKASSQ